MEVVITQIKRWVPSLKHKLRQTDIPDTADEFIKKMLVASFLPSLGIGMFLAGGTRDFLGQKGSLLLALCAFPAIFLLVAFYLFKIPDYKIRKKEIGISREIVFAARFLMIEIESGVPIYNAFINVSRVYPVVGAYFKSIVDQIDMGTSIEDAINDTIELVPSQDLRKIMWQVLNSIKTGADVSGALNAVLDQIINDQKIEVEEYGRKLNPLAMFYMLMAVILPSLGSTMLIIFASFIGIQMKLPMLLTIAGLLAFMQFMFYGLIKSARPAVEL